MFRVIFSFIYIIAAILSATVETRGNSGGIVRDNNETDTLGGLLMKRIRRRNRRINALKTAAPYLKPYEKIFSNQTLSNKFCTLSMNSKTKTITVLSGVYNAHGRKMAATTSEFSADIDEYFDTIAELFSYNTTYDGLLSSLKAVAAVNEVPYKIRKETEPARQNFPPKPLIPAKETENFVAVDFKNREVLDLADELIDINNCSEAELTALPGISIIMAKKIIVFRETKHPFKNVEEFFKVMKIKPHFAKQLEKLLCAKKINMRKVKKAQRERTIDL